VAQRVVLLVFAEEPLLDALGVEEVATDGNSYNVLHGFELFHTDHALLLIVRILHFGVEEQQVGSLDSLFVVEYPCSFHQAQELFVHLPLRLCNFEDELLPYCFCPCRVELVGQPVDLHGEERPS